MRSILPFVLVSLLLGTVSAAPAQSHCQPSFPNSQYPSGDDKLTVCGDKLTAGGVATLTFTGGPPNQFAELHQSSSSYPIPLGGGMLYPENSSVTAILLDENGSYTMDIQGGGGPSVTVYQVVYPSPGRPAGIELSNAVQAYKLPDNRPVIKVVFALPVYPDGTYSRTEDEAQQMADALCDSFEYNSYGLFELDIHVEPPFTMPNNTSYYESPPPPAPKKETAYLILQDVVSVLDEDLVADADYLVVHSERLWGNGVAGLGGLNGKYTLIKVDNQAPDDYLLLHEFGHTMGLNHAGRHNKTKPGEVGDNHRAHPFDPMGAGAPTFSAMNNLEPLHFNSWSKMQMGWIPPDNVFTVDANTAPGTEIRLLPNDNPRCAVPGGGVAVVAFRHSATHDWVIYNHVEDDTPGVPTAQPLVVRVPYTEQLPTLLTGSNAGASGEFTLITDQNANSTGASHQLLAAGIPEGETNTIEGKTIEGATTEFHIEHVQTLPNNEVILRFTPEDQPPGGGYSQNRVANFVLDHSERGEYFVSGVFEMTALDILPAGESEITSFEFEIFGGGDGLRGWINGSFPTKPNSVETSGILYPGVPPLPPAGDSAGYSPAAGDFRWILNTATTLNNKGYVVIGSAYGPNGVSRRWIPIQVQN